MDDAATVRALAALGEATRFIIVRILSEARQPMTAGDLNRATSLALGTALRKNSLSAHMRVLVDAGIVSSTKEGRFVRYALVSQVCTELGEVVLSLR